MAVNETTTKFKVDISELKKGIQDANRQIKLANAEFKAASAGMDKWSDSADGVSAKITQTQKVLKAQKTILSDYEKQLKLISAEYGDNSKEADEMRIKIENQRAAVIKSEKSLADYEKALSDIESGQNDASKSSDDLGEALDDASKHATDAGNGGFSVLKGALANLVADGIELALQGLKKLGDKIIEVGKQSISNYADYEQLVGGVETLFGAQGKSLEDYAKSVGKSTSDVKKEYDRMMRAQKTVLNNASKAYSTAGLSANEYMETVTGFSASLIQGLGGDTEKAAKIADRAITDMSDNANKMGTDISMIQNAYQGFAKQNYTMLDNLKLGYGGTKSEMARLINDSGVLGDEIKVTAETVNDVSFDKMIEAIHKVQDEMGITGTTAAEAASTIEGSKNAMQAAWQNLMTGLADEDADVSALFDSFMTSAETYLGNILPRIEALVTRTVDFVKEKLEEKFPAAMEVVEKVFSAAKGAFGWIMDNKDAIIAALAGIGTAIVAWNIATVVTNIVKMVKAIKLMGAASAFAAAKQWLLNTALFANPIGLVVAAIAGLVAAFVVLWNKSEAFRKFWIKLWDKIKNAAGKAWEKIKGFFTLAWAVVQLVWKSAAKFFKGIWDGIKKVFNSVVDFFKKVFSDAWNAVKKVWSTVISFFTGIWNGIKKVFNSVADFFKKVFSAALDAVKKIWNTVTGFFSGLWEGIKNVFSSVVTFFSTVFTNALNAVKTVWSAVTGFFSGLWEGIKNVFSSVVTFFSTVFTNALNAVKTVWSAVTGFFSGIWDGIKSVFKNTVSWFTTKFQAALDAVQNVWNTIKQFFADIWEGIKAPFVSAATWFKDKFDAVVDKIKAPFVGLVDWFKKLWEDIKNVWEMDSVGESLAAKINEHLPVGVTAPPMANGGVLKRGQIGLLEGNGAEAVVPLENNRKWIAATAASLKSALKSEGLLSGSSSTTSSVTNNYFTQNNNSPKALSRLEIYRQSKNLLDMKGAT